MTTHGTALITGASSGIGAAYARRLASLGHDVILVARRQGHLAAIAAELQRGHNVRAEILPADLADRSDLERVERRTADLPDLEFLINAAGFGIAGAFAETDLQKHLKMIDCHVVASVRLCRAALPGMIARRRGAIINVCSIGAFMPKPWDTTYCATKAYLKVFSEALQAELHGTGVRVQAPCPGFTLTEFHDSPEYARFHIKARVPRAFWMTADEVAASSLKALGHGPVVFIPGLKNRLLVMAVTLVPKALLRWTAARRMRGRAPSAS